VSPGATKAATKGSPGRTSSGTRTRRGASIWGAAVSDSGEEFNREGEKGALRKESCFSVFPSISALFALEEKNNRKGEEGARRKRVGFSIFLSFFALFALEEAPGNLLRGELLITIEENGEDVERRKKECLDPSSSFW
jgi:hypothetical protein